MAVEAAEGVSDGSPNVDQGCGRATRGLRLAKPFVACGQISLSLRLIDKECS